MELPTWVWISVATKILRAENMLAQDKILNRSDGCSKTRGSSPSTCFGIGSTVSFLIGIKKYTLPCPSCSCNIPQNRRAWDNRVPIPRQKLASMNREWSYSLAYPALSVRTKHSYGIVSPSLYLCFLVGSLRKVDCLLAKHYAAEMYPKGPDSLARCGAGTQGRYRWKTWLRSKISTSIICYSTVVTFRLAAIQ